MWTFLGPGGQGKPQDSSTCNHFTACTQPVESGDEPGIGDGLTGKEHFHLYCSVKCLCSK
jgi:hypothetical protein